MSSQLYRSNPIQHKIVAGLVSLMLFGVTQLSHATTTPLTLQNTAGAWTTYTLAPEAFYYDGVYDGGAHASSLVKMNGLSWGESPTAGGPQSGLIFNPTSNGSSIALGAAFAFGTLSHSNQLIYSDTAINSANLQLQLTLGGVESSVTTGPFNYNFSIFESLNAADPSACPIWQVSATNCDDKISFSAVSQSQQFSLDGRLYSFNLLGFSDTLVTDMITTEQMITTRNLMASITAVPVPVPAALWLFGSGLLGLAGFAKRKRTHQ